MGRARQCDGAGPDGVLRRVPRSHGSVRAVAGELPVELRESERTRTRRRAGHVDAVDPGRALPLRPCGRTARRWRGPEHPRDEQDHRRRQFAPRAERHRAGARCQAHPGAARGATSPTCALGAVDAGATPAQHCASHGRAVDRRIATRRSSRCTASKAARWSATTRTSPAGRATPSTPTGSPTCAWCWMPSSSPATGTARCTPGRA